MDGLTECRGTLRRRAAASSWTDERIAYVAERWSQGITARQIAQELGGGLSHSAVMGKIHRLGIAGLSPNAWAHRKRRGGDERRIPQWMVTLLISGIPLRQQRLPPVWVIKAKPYVDDPGLDADIPLAQRRSLLELASDNCRWPVGDPSTGDFFFCGAQPLQGTPYCAAHEARARRSGGQIAGHGKPARRRAGDHSRGARAASGGEVANKSRRVQVGR